MSTLSLPAPSDESVVLSPSWLSAAISQRYPGSQVTDVTVVERLQTVATKIRFTVTYANDVGAPEALCVKAYLHPDMQSRGSSGQQEVRFYTELAEFTGVNAPELVYGAIDPESGHGLILMKDLVAEGCVFRTALSPYTVNQAAETLDQLAQLHASAWDKDSVPGESSFTSQLEATLSWVTPERLQEHLDGLRTAGLPDSMKDGARARAAMLAVVRADAELPRTIVHGDAHAGNTYDLPDGRVGLIDWQVLRLGGWATDVAYHIGAVLDVDERERSERALLEHYLDRLAAHGVTPPTWDEAWLRYRTHLAYGYWMWAITKFVEPKIVNAFTYRLGSAASHHDTFGLLGV